LDNTEGVFLVRHGKIRRIVAGDLKKHAGIRAAFVHLTCRMKKPRTKAKTRCNALAVADQDADILERIAMRVIALNISKQRAVITRPKRPEMSRETFH